MKAYCIFYGTKYSYNLVVDLQKEFNKCGVSLTDFKFSNL